MRVGLVALSRKRHKYFTLLSQRAPEDVTAFAIRGARFSRNLFFSLVTRPTNFPLEHVQLHLQRQQINYPIFFKLKSFRRAAVVVVRWVESVRLSYYQKLFVALSLDAVCIWNGQKIPYSTVALAAKACNLSVWYFENGVLPATTTIDPKGVNADSAVSRRPDLYPIENSSFESQVPVGKAISVLLPLQVESDTQVVIHSHWVKTSRELVLAVVSALKGLPLSAKIIVRQHPLARTSFLASDLPKSVCFDSDTSLSNQLEQCDVVVTMNSTVGLEAVQLGKPVVVTAAALYGVKDVVKRAGSQVQLKNALSEILVEGWRPTRAKSFVSELVDHYCIAGDWRDLGGSVDLHCSRVWKRLCGLDRYNHNHCNESHQS